MSAERRAQALQVERPVVRREQLAERDLADLGEGLVVLAVGLARRLDGREAERIGLKTAVVSSSDTAWIERHLGRLGRLEGLDAIVAANGDTGRAKPRPDLYVEALERLGLEPAEAIAFEDSPNGIRAAKAAH